MKKNNFVFGSYFCGNKISDYGLEHGFVDYATLAKSFDAVLNNDIMATLENQGFYFELENGFVDNSEEIDELRDQIADLEDLITADSTEEQDNATSEKIAELEDRIAELEEEQDGQGEIFQYFIISSQGAEILESYTNELVFYNSDLDIYIWGVTHWGTSWSNVLTDIKCNVESEKGA